MNKLYAKTTSHQQLLRHRLRSAQPLNVEPPHPGDNAFAAKSKLITLSAIEWWGDCCQDGIGGKLLVKHYNIAALDRLGQQLDNPLL
jgi:hypothetical protein